METPTSHLHQRQGRPPFRRQQLHSTPQQVPSNTDHNSRPQRTNLPRQVTQIRQNVFLRRRFPQPQGRDRHRPGLDVHKATSVRHRLRSGDPAGPPPESDVHKAQDRQAERGHDIQREQEHKGPPGEGPRALHRRLRRPLRADAQPLELCPDAGAGDRRAEADARSGPHERRPRGRFPVLRYR